MLSAAVVVHHVTVGDAAGAALASVGVTVRQNVVHGVFHAVHQITGCSADLIADVEQALANV